MQYIVYVSIGTCILCRRFWLIFICTCPLPPQYAVLYKGFIPRVQCLPNPGSEETDFGEQETNQPDIDPFIQNMFTKPKCLDYLGKFRQKPLVIQHVSQIVTAKMLGGRWKERAMTHGHIKEEDETVEGDDVVIEGQNLPSEQEESTEDLDTSIVADTLITATHNGNVAEENTDSAPMKETEPLHHQRSSLDDVKEHLHLTRQLSKGFTNAATDVSPIPAFIPGMVYHIETRRHPTWYVMCGLWNQHFQNCTFQLYTCIHTYM